MTEELPLDTLHIKQEQMNQRLNELRQRGVEIEVEANAEPIDNQPVYNSYQMDDVLNLEIELPGVTEESVEVDLSSNRLKITGCFPELPHVPKDAYQTRNRKRGRFEYTFNIPPEAKVHTQSAPYFSRGVLYINFRMDLPIN